MRHFILGLCSLLFRPLLKRSLRKPRIHFIMMHELCENQYEKFSSLINVLRINNAEFITHKHALMLLKQNKIEKPYYCLSFDDGLSSCRSAGLFLKMLEVPACFFINGASIGLTGPRAEEFGRKRLKNSNASFMSVTDLKNLLMLGHEVESHGFEHVNLATVSEEELDNDLKKNELWSENELNHKFSLFAWPYGRLIHIKQAMLSNVKAFRYLGVFSGERGSGYDKTLSFLYRDNIELTNKTEHILFFLQRSAGLIL